MISNWLLIDIGNTRIKWALASREGLRFGRPIVITQLDVKTLSSAFDAIDLVTGIAISNVAGREVQESIVAYAEARWSISPLIVSSARTDMGVISGYQEPKTLGVDRWLTLIAAQSRGVLPCLIVDLGSACTLDILDLGGRHLGGYILPGYQAMRSALVGRTKLIVGSDHQLGGTLSPGSQTQSCIASGVYLSLVGAIEKAHDLFVKDHERSLAIILTGGDSMEIAKILTKPYEVIPDLVIQGLWVYVKSTIDSVDSASY